MNLFPMLFHEEKKIKVLIFISWLSVKHLPHSFPSSVWPPLTFPGQGPEKSLLLSNESVEMKMNGVSVPLGTNKMLA